jgi:phage/plasmid-like protein (TIGR03299 family)
MVREKIFGNFRSVSGTMTAKEAIKEARLDYEVKKAPVKFESESLGINDSGDFTTIKTPQDLDKRFVTYRSDTGQGFDVVSDKYYIVQNEQAFTFFDSIVGEGKAIYENAGCIGNGEKIFLQAKLPNSENILGEEYSKYLTLLLSHDGKGSIKCYFTPVRIWCNNTLVSSLRGAINKVSIRHSSNAESQLKDAHNLMGISKKYFQDTKEFLEQATKIKVDKALYGKTLKELFLDTKEIAEMAEKGLRLNQALNEGIISTRKANIINDVYNYTTGHETQQSDICKGTAYGLLQGVTGYFQNMKNYKDATHKFENIMEGTSQKVVQHCVQLVEDMMV